jgi:hypothetical protein
MDVNGMFFVTDNRNDMRAERWICEISASSDSDGYVRDVTHR